MALIFSLNFFLSKSTGKFGVLLASFLKLYTNATDFEIGLVLTSVPIVMTIAKPILCTLMDRTQAHKSFLILSYGFLCLGYVPFVVIPFLGPGFYVPYARVCLYILTAFNIISDVGSAVVETLDDTLALNYAKQVGARFTIYRMWGTISYGVVSLFIGQVNDGFWIVPKYTPIYVFLLLATLFMMLLIHIWPDEHFVIAPCDVVNTKSGAVGPQVSDKLAKINVGEEMRRHLLDMLPFSSSPQNAGPQSGCNAPGNLIASAASTLQMSDKENKSRGMEQQLDNQELRKVEDEEEEESKLAKAGDVASAPKSDSVSKSAQFRIFVELLVRDPRIVGYLAVTAFCGTTLQLQYFLYLHLTNSCTTNKDCNYSQLAGYMQAAAAFAECLTFLISEPLVWRIGRLATLNLAMLTLVVRYLFYAALYVNVNPYFAIAAEGSFGLVTGIYSTIKPEIAYMFANEVGLVLPTLVERGKIDLGTNLESLKKCLASSMQGAFSLAYSGLGRSLGALVAGAVIGLRNQYEDLWLFSALCCFVVGSVFGVLKLLSLCFDLRPRLIRQLTCSRQTQSESA